MVKILLNVVDPGEEHSRTEDRRRSDGPTARYLGEQFRILLKVLQKFVPSKAEICAVCKWGCCIHMDMLVYRLVCPDGFVTYIGDHFRLILTNFRFGSNLRRGVVGRGGEAERAAGVAVIADATSLEVSG